LLHMAAPLSSNRLPYTESQEILMTQELSKQALRQAELRGRDAVQ
jgi:hypothetical protein